MEDHLPEQVASTPLGLFVRLGYPVQTLVRTLNRHRSALKSGSRGAHSWISHKTGLAEKWLTRVANRGDLHRN